MFTNPPPDRHPSLPLPPPQVTPTILSFILLTLFSLSTLTTTSQIPDPQISYPEHCSHLIPPPPFTTTTPHFTATIPILISAYASPSAIQLLPFSPSSANLFPLHLFSTSLAHVLKLDATLTLRRSRFLHRDRNLLNIHGGPRIPVATGAMFGLSGYWDSSSGQLCMVGSGTKRLVNNGLVPLNVVFKANYPNHSLVNTSLVVGTLESLSLDGKNDYFKPVYVMGFNRLGYNYTLINNEIDVNESGGLSDQRMGFRSCNQVTSLADYFELSYGGDCGGGRSCSLIDDVVGFSPRFMSLNEIDCKGDRMIRVAFVLSNVSDVRNGVRQPLEPSRTWVAEGAWSRGKTKLDFVACRILNFTDSPLMASVGDCSIRMEFKIADTLTLRNSSVITGRIWSKKGVDEPGYFDSIEVQASGTRRAALPDMKYVYTESGRARKFCAGKKGVVGKGKIYPDALSQDMKFDMEVRNSKGKTAWGKAHPVFVDDRFVQNMYPYFRTSVLPNPHSGVEVNSTLHDKTLSNVAYRFLIKPKEDYKVGGKTFSMGEKIIISAEGIYDANNGRLCMVGCWNRESDGIVPRNSSRQDCDIFINIQFPPRDSENNEVVKGTIESKRVKNSDPLYFEHLDLSGTSLSTAQVRDVFWRTDFEITMVLISNTLACIFVGLQLFHVKKHPEVLPFISVVMLIVITLGHMIPLLLNMEAFFLSTPSKKTVLFGTGGWLEVNEVLVRVITMVAFLLEFWLLQLTWSARGADENQRATLQVSEKRVVIYCLPLYACGALVAWLVQLLRGSPKTALQSLRINPSGPLTFWGDVKSFAGFVLDAFLLPQILFNAFSDSKEMTLSIPYYLGTTVVRLLPHAYDLFRAHSSSWGFDPWYIYANPRMNYYSTTWDILISCLGLVFVILIYLQQRLGGQWILPRRHSKTAAYEMVPLGL